MSFLIVMSASCAGTSFSGARMHSADFQRCYDLSDANFLLADLREASFLRAMGSRSSGCDGPLQLVSSKAEAKALLL